VSNLSVKLRVALPRKKRNEESITCTSYDETAAGIAPAQANRVSIFGIADFAFGQVKDGSAG